jgi:hypothetical protein
MNSLMTFYIIALIYRDVKPTCIELAECFSDLSHDSFTRLLRMRISGQREH